MMNKKNILLALLVLGIVVLTIVGPPTNAVYAHDTETHVLGLSGYPTLELAGYYRVEFTDVTTVSAQLERGGPCPIPCTTHGEGEGYFLILGYGDSESECVDDARNHEQEFMTEKTRETLWDETGPCREPTLGQTACLFYCCQPYPAIMWLGWRYWEEIVE